MEKRVWTHAAQTSRVHVEQSRRRLLSLSLEASNLSAICATGTAAAGAASRDQAVPGSSFQASETAAILVGQYCQLDDNNP